MKIPPGTPRSRSFTRFTMRVGLPHLGQSVLLDVSISFCDLLFLQSLPLMSPDTNLPAGRARGTEMKLGVIYCWVSISQTSLRDGLNFYSPY